jgi:hypothetical protein
MPTRRSDRAARLLLRALDTLKPQEREVVLEALLTGSVGRRAASLGESALVFGRYPSFAPQAGQQMEQPLLVRLPSSLHTRFRRWATENGFSMAAVARGLIERFLDEQSRAGGE